MRCYRIDATRISRETKQLLLSYLKRVTIPILYMKNSVATLAIGRHIIAGAGLLVLGPIQFFNTLQIARCSLMISRFYRAMAFLTSLSGLGFIAFQGTIGATVMDGCWLWFVWHSGCRGIDRYSILWQTTSLRSTSHMGNRLFTLAIGSWLYRMDYGLWQLIANGANHTRSFDGPFDIIVVFMFYIPNLLVAIFS